MALARSCRAAFAPLHRANRLHTSAVLSARQNAAATPAPTKTRRAVPDLEPLKFDDEVLQDQLPAEDDAPEPTHRYFQQQRNMLYYLRLIEHEMPKLVGAWYSARLPGASLNYRLCSVPQAVRPSRCVSTTRRPFCLVRWRATSGYRQACHRRPSRSPPAQERGSDSQVQAAGRRSVEPGCTYGCGNFRGGGRRRARVLQDL